MWKIKLKLADPKNKLTKGTIREKGKPRQTLSLSQLGPVGETLDERYFHREP